MNKQSQEIKNIQDKFFWDIYSRPVNTVGFLKDVLPSNILKALDLTHIKVDKKSYLSEEYKEQMLSKQLKQFFQREVLIWLKDGQKNM